MLVDRIVNTKSAVHKSDTLTSTVPMYKPSLVKRNKPTLYVLNVYNKFLFKSPGNRLNEFQISVTEIK